jgi:hypothetical protein
LKYNRDGQFCTWTEAELLKWQTYDAKLSKKDRTGKWNKASIDFLKKHFKNTTPKKKSGVVIHQNIISQKVFK